MCYASISALYFMVYSSARAHSLEICVNLALQLNVPRNLLIQLLRVDVIRKWCLRSVLFVDSMESKIEGWSFLMNASGDQNCDPHGLLFCSYVIVQCNHNVSSMLIALWLAGIVRTQQCDPVPVDFVGSIAEWKLIIMKYGSEFWLMSNFW